MPWNTLALEFAAGLGLSLCFVLHYVAARRSTADPELREEANAAIAEALDVLALPGSRRPALIVHNGLSATRR